MNETLIKVQNYLINPELIGYIEIILPTDIKIAWDYIKDDVDNISITNINDLPIEINLYFIDKEHSLTLYKYISSIISPNDFKSIFISTSLKNCHSIRISGNNEYLSVWGLEGEPEDYIPNIKKLWEDQLKILEKEKLNLEYIFKNIMKKNTIQEIIL